MPPLSGARLWRRGPSKGNSLDQLLIKTNFDIEFDTVVSNNIYGEGMNFTEKEESYGNHEKRFFKGFRSGFDQP